MENVFINYSKTLDFNCDYIIYQDNNYHTNIIDNFTFNGSEYFTVIQRLVRVC